MWTAAQGKIVNFAVLSDLPKQSGTGRTSTKEVFVIYMSLAKNISHSHFKVAVNWERCTMKSK